MKLAISMCFALLITTVAQAQKKTFIRIFDEAGRKVHKGYLMAVSDTSVTVSLGKNTFEISVNQVGMIKLKRSFGHTILLCAIPGGALFAASGASLGAFGNAFGGSASGTVISTIALDGFFIGVGTGAIIGSIIPVLQKRPVYIINKDHNEWIKVKDQLKYFLPMGGGVNKV